MTAKAPPRPNRAFLFTLKQFFEMGDRGYFDDRKVELLRGEIVEMSPVNWPHHLGVQLTAEVLRGVFRTGHFVDTQQTFPIPASALGTAPQPDVAVIPGAPRDYSAHPTAAVLLVEVSESTLDYDLTTKAEMYATAGVPEYWVLDIEGRALHVFRDPQSLPLPQDLTATAYQTHLTLAPTDSVSPLGAPQASILVSELLP